MNTKECIDILNAIIKKKEIVGFNFVMNKEKCIELCIPCADSHTHTFVNSHKHTFKIVDEELNLDNDMVWGVLDCIMKSKEMKSNLITIVDGAFREFNFLGVNYSGIHFLKSMKICSTINELFLKLQLMGYKI